MPATGNFVLDKGYRAAGAITKFRAVKFSAPETVTPVTAITDQIAGVAQFSVSAAELARGKGTLVRTMGQTEMEAAGAIPLNSAVSINTSGQAIVAATGGRVIGVCVGAAAVNAGDRCTVRLAVSGALAP
jgi:3D (Asp-Asp-Asp) domain-containing protein